MSKIDDRLKNLVEQLNKKEEHSLWRVTVRHVTHKWFGDGEIIYDVWADSHNDGYFELKKVGNLGEVICFIEGRFRGVVDYVELLKKKKKREENEQKVYESINFNFHEMERNFCIDFDVLDGLEYTEDALRDKVEEVFYYLMKFSASRETYSNTVNNTVKFSEFSITMRESFAATNVSYTVNIAGIDICKLVDLADGRRVLVSRDDYMQHVIYYLNYILYNKKVHEAKEKESKAEHIDAALKQYKC